MRSAPGNAERASAGSDLAGIKTTAIHDGAAYVVNGQKMFVGSSHGADYSWTIVVSDPKGERHKNLSWLMIPMDLPGITVQPMDLLATGGEGGSGSGVKNAVFFDNVACLSITLWAARITVGKSRRRTSKSSTAAWAASPTGG